MNNLYVANRGYAAIGKQTDKDTVIASTVYIPFTSCDLDTDDAKHQQTSNKGNRNAVQDVHLGLRSHVGTITFLAEPNTIGYLMNMFMTKGTTTGAGPYTHPFTVGATESYYTLNIKKGAYVERYVGVKIHSMKPTYVDNVLYLECGVAALRSFKVSTLSGTPSGSGPYTVTLATDHDPSPTSNLVVGDVLIFDDGTTQTEATIATIPSVTTFTTVTNVASYGADHKIYLKEGTPSFTLLTPFTWARTEWRFAATAASALSAAQTRLDDGTEWSLTHENEDDEGAHTTGGYDPEDFRRTVFRAEATIVRVYSELDSLIDFEENAKKSVVIRHFAGNDTTYELRITLNNLKQTENKRPAESDGIVKQTIKFACMYDSSDAQAVDVKVLNAVSSI